jgi:hypothetical protein
VPELADSMTGSSPFCTSISLVNGGSCIGALGVHIDAPENGGKEHIGLTEESAYTLKATARIIQLMRPRPRPLYVYSGG